LLLALGACALTPAAAQAGFVAFGRDPSGDASAPEAGRDLLAAGVGYDRRGGRLLAGFELRGVPRDGGAFVTVAVARRTATGCDGAPAAGFSTYTDETDSRWLRFASLTEVTASGEASKRGGTLGVQQLEVDDRRLANLPLDCAIIALTEPGNPQNVYDEIGPLTLRPQPSLALRLGGLPEEVRSGRPYSLKVTVSNPGDAPTGRIRVKLAQVRGLSAAPRTLTLRSLRPGRRRTATIRVTLGERADRSTELRVNASAGRLKLDETYPVSVRTPTPAPPPSGGGGGGGGNDGGGSRTCVRWIPDFSGESGGSLGLVPC
jgi:hypothetical protein